MSKALKFLLVLSISLSLITISSLFLHLYKNKKPPLPPFSIHSNKDKIHLPPSGSNKFKIYKNTHIEFSYPKELRIKKASKEEKEGLNFSMPVKNNTLKMYLILNINKPNTSNTSRLELFLIKGLTNVSIQGQTFDIKYQPNTKSWVNTFNFGGNSSFRSTLLKPNSNLRLVKLESGWKEMMYSYYLIYNNNYLFIIRKPKFTHNPQKKKNKKDKSYDNTIKTILSTVRIL